MPGPPRSLADELLEAAPDAILLVRPDGSIAVANPMVERVFGYARGELLGRSIELLIPHDIRDVHAKNRATYAAHPTTRQMGGRALYGQRKDGTIISVDVSLSPMESAQGPMTIAIVRDVSQRLELEQKLRHASTHDALTGLFNRTHLDAERARLEAEDLPLGVALLDVDGLKPINDRLGHEAGDEMLRRTAQVLLAAASPSDLVVRLGGDEFVIVRSRCVPSDLTDLRARIEAELHRHNQQHPQLRLELSCGGARTDPSGTLAQAMRAADERMYAQKRERASSRPPTGGGP